MWQLHQVYSSDAIKDWVQEGCRAASIGCLDCKRPIIEAVQAELAPMRERAQEFIENPNMVRAVINEGTEAAREVARDTLDEVRQAMGLGYR